MDPIATLARIEDAHSARDLEGFIEANIDLQKWLEHGGFVPAISASQLQMLLVLAGVGAIVAGMARCDVTALTMVHGDI